MNVIVHLDGFNFNADDDRFNDIKEVEDYLTETAGKRPAFITIGRVTFHSTRLISVETVDDRPINITVT